MHTPLLPCPAIRRRPMLIFAICWTFISCGHTNRQPAVDPPETPKALQDNRSALGEVRLVSKSSRGEDLVESLYQELVKKDTSLTELEARLDRLPGKKSDSTKPFNGFDGKNNEYYGSAGQHIVRIKDSVLRKRVEVMIAESDTAYRNMTARHRGLIADMNGKELSLEDLHEVLKLTRTLPVIAKYQKDHVPSTGVLLSMVKEYERTMRQAEELIKK